MTQRLSSRAIHHETRSIVTAAVAWTLKLRFGIADDAAQMRADCRHGIHSRLIMHQPSASFFDRNGAVTRIFGRRFEDEARLSSGCRLIAQILKEHAQTHQPRQTQADFNQCTARDFFYRHFLPSNLSGVCLQFLSRSTSILQVVMPAYFWRDRVTLPAPLANGQPGWPTRSEHWYASTSLYHRWIRLYEPLPQVGHDIAPMTLLQSTDDC